MILARRVDSMVALRYGMTSSRILEGDLSKRLQRVERRDAMDQVTAER